jgi:hypothetical protein
LKVSQDMTALKTIFKAKAGGNLSLQAES